MSGKVLHDYSAITTIHSVQFERSMWCSIQMNIGLNTFFLPIGLTINALFFAFNTVFNVVFNLMFDQIERGIEQ